MQAGPVTLTPLTVDDAGDMAGVLAAAELYTFTGGTPPTTGELRERYGRQVLGRSADGAEEWHNWIVRRVPDGQPVGYVQATITGPSAEIAWVIGLDHQGNGYATAAAKALVGWLGEHEVERVVAHVHPEHEASNAVARRLELRPTGDFDDGERRWERDL